MTRTEMKQKIDQGASMLNQVAVALGCSRERDMVHDAAARLFLASCGEKEKRNEDDRWETERPPIDSEDL
jgi:hypothetical protein